MKSIDTSLMGSLCEGLVGYATYESRAGLGAAMSEVVFYMPVLRIAKHLEWKSRVEFGLPNSEHRAGDKSRVDFVFERETKSAGKHGLVIEMKWEPKVKKGAKINLLESEWTKMQMMKESAARAKVEHFSAWQLVLGRKGISKVLDPSNLSLQRDDAVPVGPPEVCFQTTAGLGYFCNAYRVI
jgi:hypothetical protein